VTHRAKHYKHCLRERPWCSACEEYLAVLAHELRSPLASISTGLDLLKTTVNDPEIMHEVHEIMQRQVTHLTALIDELFDISRTRGTFAMESENINGKSGGEGSSTSSAEGSGASGLRILVVDDNRPAADMLAMILETYGNELFIAYSGQQAVQLAETRRPDVILLDLSMPVMDGYEVARTIRRQPRGQEPMLIALTGWVLERDKQKARDAGFDHHVVKPAKATDLRGILSHAKRRWADARTP
jgi:CheY-like chemotaxis protein